VLQCVVRRALQCVVQGVLQRVVQCVLQQTMDLPLHCVEIAHQIVVSEIN